MALKLNIQNINLPLYLRLLMDIEEEDQFIYLKIDCISGNSDLTFIVLSAGVITGQETINDFTSYKIRNIRIPSSNYSFVPNLDGPNFIEQGYQYLKTLPEFSGFEDC